MAVVNEIIRAEADGTLSFGNYIVTEKQKLNDFKFGGHIYKVKTSNELTRFERDDKMLLETVPGTAIHNFKLVGENVEFFAEGNGNTQFTVGLEPETEYNIVICGELAGTSNSGISSKINFGAELDANTPCEIKIEKA